MLFRIIVGIALSVMAIGFLWFMAQVIYLGVKEFFKIHRVLESSDKRTKDGQQKSHDQD